MPAAKDNDASIMSAVLRHIYRTYRKGPWHYFIPGFHEDDPLATCLEEYRCIPASGRLYEIVYPEELQAVSNIKRSLVPYIEPFSL